jgi:ABC-type transport system substrate-binding protein
MKPKHGAILGSVLAASLLVSACSTGDGGDGGTAAEQTAAIWIEGEPALLSPLIGRSGQAFQVMTLIYDTLWKTSPEGELVGSLAESWEVSDDGKEFTIKLREGVEWSDGEPFTVDDVIFSYTMMANQTISQAAPGRFATIEGFDAYNSGAADSISGLEKVDDTTLIVRHATPNASWIDEIIGASQFIVPEHVLGEVPLEQLYDNAFFTEPTVFIGPFALTEWRTGEYIELERNEAYRSDVGLDSLYVEWGDPNAAMASLETGDITVMPVGPADKERLESAGLIVDVIPGLGPLRWAAKWEDGPMSNPLVRQALMYAIDREGMIDALLEGQGTVIDQPFMNAMEKYIPAGVTDYGYDPDKARELLDAAGWVPGTTIRLSYEPGGEVAGEEVATIAQQQLAEVGIDVELRPLEGGAHVEMLQSRDFELAQYAGGRYSSPATLISTHLCRDAQPAGPNNSGYCNPRVDELFELGRAETDPDKLQEIYEEMALIFDKELPYIWLVNYSVLWAYSPDLENFAPHPDGGTLWEPENWRIAG